MGGIVKSNLAKHFTSWLRVLGNELSCDSGNAASNWSRLLFSQLRYDGGGLPSSSGPKTGMEMLWEHSDTELTVTV